MSDLSPLPGGFLKFVCWLCLLLLWDFSSLFADLPAVEQYCSGLRRKVGEFCIILSHLPSLLQTLSYFYLSPQMLTRLAFQVEGYLVTPIFRFVGELQVQFWLSWSSQSSLQLQWSEVTSSSLQNHNWVQLKITVGWPPERWLEDCSQLSSANDYMRCNCNCVQWSWSSIHSRIKKQVLQRSPSFNCIQLSQSTQLFCWQKLFTSLESRYSTSLFSNWHWRPLVYFVKVNWKWVWEGFYIVFYDSAL